MTKSNRGRAPRKRKPPHGHAADDQLRIIGGKFRGCQIERPASQRTRPMKDSIREALFNLVGGWIPGKAAIDLFAGSGAVGLEALSRGASQVILIERHFPTAKLIRSNADSLARRLAPGETACVEVEACNTFFWGRQFIRPDATRPIEPWIVFCCPPYALFLEEPEPLLGLLESLIELAPPESLFVVESDRRFSTKLLPLAELWASREYSPAVISVYRHRFPDSNSAIRHA